MERFAFGVHSSSSEQIELVVLYGLLPVKNARLDLLFQLCNPRVKLHDRRPPRISPDIFQNVANKGGAEGGDDDQMWALVTTLQFFIIANSEPATRKWLKK